MFALFSKLPGVLLPKCRTCHISAQRMASVYVRCVPGDEDMEISLRYGHNSENYRTYNLKRRQNEEITRALGRLQNNILNSVSKKKKKKAKAKEPGTDPVQETDIAVNLFVEGNKVDGSTINKYAWIQGAELEICGTRLTVDVNSPTIRSISLPSNLMAGFPLFPKCDAEFVNVNECSFKWYRTKLRDSGEASSAKENNNTEGQEQYDICKVSDGITYTPTIGDIGFHLKIECIPRKGNRIGVKCESISECEVSAGPGPCPFETRQLYTQQETETGSFRVMTYNILADLYADSDFSRQQLFPYCPPYALAIDYRRQLLLKEITGYNADIICLQECDMKVFQHDLLPFLDNSGFAGWMKRKGTKVSEGSATFYRKSKFSLVGNHGIMLSEFLSEPANADLWERVSQKTALRDKMMERTTILQVTLLQSTHNPDYFLCVANTHLYFHPRADNIRALQIGLSMRFLQQLCEPYVSEGRKMSVVFCGDFNSSMKRAVNVLVTTGHIPEDFDDWASGGEEELIGCELSHDFKMISACGYPEYTNYTMGFHGLLDYIFTDTEHLEVMQVIPMPDHNEVTQHGALPSVVFPSDHIPQICDMRWKSVI
ncbi:2',5'-phosphodiesterase 12-like [Haliotis asinina]|uniref:2',5'-phosphodiesterase 12-like n=1 Tax=Haliotis asinina TaxID=109174 RepID=UPI00353267B8